MGIKNIGRHIDRIIYMTLLSVVGIPLDALTALICSSNPAPKRANPSGTHTKQRMIHTNESTPNDGCPDVCSRR